MDNVNRLFREDSTIVSYTDTDVKDGKITVGGIKYVIDKATNAARRDVVWTKESVTWTASYEDTAETAKAVFILKDDTPSANRVSVSADKITVVSENESENKSS